jgi:hypothetical protein
MECRSLAIDEGCENTDTAQMAIFFRGIDENHIITEELCSLVPILGTTTGQDLYNGLKLVLENSQFRWKRSLEFRQMGHVLCRVWR